MSLREIYILIHLKLWLQYAFSCLKIKHVLSSEGRVASHVDIKATTTCLETGYTYVGGIRCIRWFAYPGTKSLALPGSGTLITATLALKNHEEANGDGHLSKDSVWCKYPCFCLKSCEDIKLVWSKERRFGLWEIILFLMGVTPAPTHEWSGQACSTPSISTVQVDGRWRWAGDKRCLVLMAMCDEVPLREISKPRLWHAGEIWTRLGQVRTCENPFSYCFHIIVWFVHLYSSSWGGGSWRWLLSSALFWQCCLVTPVIWSFDIYTHTFLTWSTGCGVELWY